MRDLVDDMRRAAPELPDAVIEAAVAWVPPGAELCRSYGPASMIAYSLRAAIRAGALTPADPSSRNEVS